MTAKFSRLSNRAKSLFRQTSFNYSYNQPGSSPGTIAISEGAKPPEIVLMEYNQNELIHLTNLTPAECAAHLNTELVSWVDLAGLGDESTLQQLGKVFDLHPLVLEAVFCK